MKQFVMGTKLHLGCGKDLRPGWVNVDINPDSGADMIMDLSKDEWAPWNHGTVTEIDMFHTLEHLKNPLFVMEELWYVAAEDCKLTIKVPYGSSDNAWEDPTHIRPYFLGSFTYFSQMYYVRADYGYRGDWDVESISLDVFADRCDSNEGERVLEEIRIKRNMVSEMTAVLVPIKPIRTPAIKEYKHVHPVTLNFI